MKKILMVAALILAICACLALDFYAARNPPLADAADYFAAAELTSPQTPPVAEGLPDLAHSAGRFTLVHTWASWCPPCVTELPQLIRETHQKYPEITVIALNADPSQEAMDSAITKAYQDAGVEKDSTIQWLHDPSQTIGSLLTQSRQLPETLILSGEPKQITHHIKGATTWPLLIPYLLSKK